MHQKQKKEQKIKTKKQRKTYKPGAYLKKKQTFKRKIDTYITQL